MRNKKVTWPELHALSAEYVNRTEAEPYRQILMDLTVRVEVLEALADQLGGGSVVNTPRVPTPVSNALTRSDAERALTQLRQSTAEQFRLLDAKLDNLTRPATTERASRPDLPVRTSVSSGVDYGAFAYGLSCVKRDVKNHFDNEGVEYCGELDTHYRTTVQYFADVFAKSDPSFDEATFKRQSGV